MWYKSAGPEIPGAEEAERLGREGVLEGLERAEVLRDALRNWRCGAQR